MSIAIRYYTRSGNTKKLADAIAEAVSVEARDLNVPLTEKADVLFLGSSYYGFDADESVKKFEEGMKIAKQCNKILEDAEKKITILVKDKDGELAEEEF